MFLCTFPWRVNWGLDPCMAHPSLGIWGNRWEERQKLTCTRRRIPTYPDVHPASSLCFLELFQMKTKGLFEESPLVFIVAGVIQSVVFLPSWEKASGICASDQAFFAFGKMLCSWQFSVAKGTTLDIRKKKKKTDGRHVGFGIPQLCSSYGSFPDPTANQPIFKNRVLWAFMLSNSPIPYSSLKNMQQNTVRSHGPTERGERLTNPLMILDCRMW